MVAGLVRAALSVLVILCVAVWYTDEKYISFSSLKQDTSPLWSVVSVLQAST